MKKKKIGEKLHDFWYRNKSDIIDVAFYYILSAIITVGVWAIMFLFSH